MTSFNIKVVSDAICPWCYIGRKRLERAIDIHRKTVPGGHKDNFIITWHPFYLDPTLPNVGIDFNTYAARKFGADRLGMIVTRLNSIGQAEGIKFSMNRKVGNTRNAHRLVQLAKTKSNQLENSVILELFKMYFENEGDITSLDQLVAAGEKAGLDKTEAKKWLDEGKGGTEVDREVEQARANGISGVPNFTINGKYELSGAQDPEVFLAAFASASQSSAGVSTNSSGGERC